MNKSNKTKTNQCVDVAIIGAGVSGAALAYVLKKYTNIESIAIFEKESKVAQINSKHTQNSQTLHFGDIETNYTLQKAKRVNESAKLIAGYLENNKDTNHLFSKNHKMVLAVGEEQIKILEKRVKEFKNIFPDIKLISKKEIATLEPFIVKKRKENQQIAALYSPDGFAVDFGELAKSFMQKAIQDKKRVTLYTNNKITSINQDKKFKLKIQQQNQEINLFAKTIISCAGSHSLILAQQLGLGKEFAALPVAGSFFKTKQNVLTGKCYTLQKKKLPFAAIHGDPEVHSPHQTRFGPTAKVLPLLERRKYNTFIEFLKVATISPKGIISIIKILSDPTLFTYGTKNTIYDVPIIGKWLFTKQIQKIIPSIKFKDIKRAKGYGGIRPQIVNTKTKSLQMGEAKIVGENCIFNVTPSPGASVCLKTAQNDTKQIIKWLNNTQDKKEYLFDEELFLKDHKRKKRK